MSQKLAMKRLTASDLTLFKWHFENHRAGNQKAINLNADIFIDRLYPSVPVIIEEKHGSIPLDLYIYGPGLAPAYNLQRKVQKRPSYKNYRLNGEYIDDPEDAPERFHQLQPGDFVIFDFIGDVEPYSARVVFVASRIEVDTHLHSVLDSFIGNRSMVELQSRTIERLLAKIELPEEHPVNLLILETSLEDAALDGISGMRTLRSSPYRGKVSRQALDRARKNAQQTGRLGEELLIAYLQEKKDKGQILDFHWEADENAISPYDFSITELDDSKTFLDVKSTNGNFNSRVHISYNELLQMCEAEQYDLYRVYDMNDDSMKLRIAKGLKQFADSIVTVFQNLPNGVQPDSISVYPGELHFGEEIKVLREDYESGI